TFEGELELVVVQVADLFLADGQLQVHGHEVAQLRGAFDGRLDRLILPDALDDVVDLLVAHLDGRLLDADRVVVAEGDGREDRNARGEGVGLAVFDGWRVDGR